MQDIANNRHVHDQAESVKGRDFQGSSAHYSARRWVHSGMLNSRYERSYPDCPLGKGGTGSAAFGLTRSGALGPPSGGNGGPGGSVYLTTSSQLSSLSTLRRRYIGGQGGNGSGDLRHGRRGEDILLTVPVGTVVREAERHGDAEKIREAEDRLGLDKEERRRRRWDRVFVTHPGVGIDETDYKQAETMLRRERRFTALTPTFEDEPPVLHDVGKTINEPILIARGGQGGLGNPFFTGVSNRRSSRIASRGLQPYDSNFELELKLLADVGLVGFPNAGKSTLLRGLTGRRAEVARYQFTTLNPQIGVVRVWDDGSWGGVDIASPAGEEGEGLVVEESWRERERDETARDRGEYEPLPRSDRIRARQNALETEGKQQKIEATRFTISDNPGLLPQASENVGLGHSFLRSIERSLALCYILDITRSDPASDLRVLRNELEAYKSGLSRKGAVVVLNKGDEVDEELGKLRLEHVLGAVTGQEAKMEVLVLSGKYGLGLEKLVRILVERLEVARRDEGRNISHMTL